MDLGLGVVRRYAEDFAAAMRRSVFYVPNARSKRLCRAIKAAMRRGEGVNLIGHSWGAIDAYQAATWAAGRGLVVANLVTPIRSVGHGVVQRGGPAARSG